MPKQGSIYTFVMKFVVAIFASDNDDETNTRCQYRKFTNGFKWLLIFFYFPFRMCLPFQLGVSTFPVRMLCSVSSSKEAHGICNLIVSNAILDHHVV